MYLLNEVSSAEFRLSVVIVFDLCAEAFDRSGGSGACYEGFGVSCVFGCWNYGILGGWVVVFGEGEEEDCGEDQGLRVSGRILVVDGRILVQMVVAYEAYEW
jgi:hypothetical protein